jgi:hypothetical protein
MDGVDIELVRVVAKLSKSEVRKILKAEGRQFEVTKSLLNLLYNLVKVGSIPVSSHQREFLDERAGSVLSLLSDGKNLEQKKKILLSQPELVLNIAASCPSVV